MSLAGIVSRSVDFYVMLVFAYVLLSWFRPSGIFYDVYKVLSQICEPYLGLFRRFNLSMGMLDLTPMVAIFVLYLIRNVLVRILLTVRL